MATMLCIVVSQRVAVDGRLWCNVMDDGCCCDDDDDDDAGDDVAVAVVVDGVRLRIDSDADEWDRMFFDMMLRVGDDASDDAVLMSWCMAPTAARSTSDDESGIACSGEDVDVDVVGDGDANNCITVGVVSWCDDSGCDCVAVLLMVMDDGRVGLHCTALHWQ